MSTDVSHVDPPPQFRVRTVLIWVIVLALVMGSIKRCHDLLIKGTIMGEMIHRLSYGMDRAEVRAILGEPSSESYDQRTWSYFYRYGSIMADPVMINSDESGRVIEIPPMPIAR